MTCPFSFLNCIVNIVFLSLIAHFTQSCNVCFFNEIIRKPNVVTNYNKYMGGVDRSDQMISYTNNVVKSFKWWKKVFFHVLAITVLDAYILFCADHPNDNMTHKLFRKQLVSHLVSNNPTNTVNKVGRPSVAPQNL
jgi:hypothetical protein